MFEPIDNVPDPHVWVRKRKGTDLRAGILRSWDRWQLVQFAKFVISEYLNGPEDVEEIVTAWLKGES